LINPLYKDRGVGPLILPVLASVLISTFCVLWFMNRAMQNERSAARDRIGQAYRASLTATANALRERWDQRLLSLNEISFAGRERTAFQDVAGSRLGHSVVVLAEAGSPIYPTRTPDAPVVRSSLQGRWGRARQTEFQASDPATAALLYEQLAGLESSETLAARAYLAQARCLAKSDARDRAAEILTLRLQEDVYAHSVDEQGRLIAANALMLAVHISGKPGDAIAALVELLNTYTESVIPASQRLFLMSALVDGAHVTADVFPTLSAERVGARFLETEVVHSGSLLGMTFGQWLRALADQPGVGRLGGTTGTVWWALSDNGRAVYLFDQSFIDRDFADVASSIGAEADVRLTLSQQVADPDAFASIPVGATLPAWQINLHLTSPDQFDLAAHEQTAFYVWVGVFSIVIMVAAAAVSTRSIGRQARLARLKNDLAATVSHELKTPIASVKVLVDTLLDGHYKDAERTVEYLQLISTENERLARLVGNFLAFSRIEQGDQGYETALCHPQDIVEDALRPIRDRLETDRFQVEVVIDDDVPKVEADRNALVAALSNLLENAYKFSRDSRQIQVRVFTSGNDVHFSIADRGIGMSKREARRVFDRFYQVDTRLARESSGVGLGLSIVKGVAEGHGGGVHVESDPGKGSTFEIHLPAAGGRSV
jgi:signal transduction histidine kinase